MFNLKTGFVEQYRQKYLFNDNTFIVNKYKYI